LSNWKHCCVAAAPVNIEARSYAHRSEPLNELPLNMLKVS